MDSDTVKVGDPRDADREGTAKVAGPAVEEESWVADMAMEYVEAYVKAFNHIAEQTDADLTSSWGWSSVHHAALEALTLVVRG